MTAAPHAPVLGVLVCCRDEERVIARRLANLAASDWPDAPRQHRVIVVDDGSRDASARLAAGFDGRSWPRGIAVEVLENGHAPGKAGAIATGVQALGSSVDLVVLTDADVVHAGDALLQLVAAFTRDPRVGMACGAQRFVAALPDDGSTATLGAGSGGAAYDRATDVVRALESRSGRVFSVHGQLLAWRSVLRLCPRPGIAADDLDLMAQARSKGARVVRASAARFFEARPTGAARQAQAVRRARAYLQFVRALRLAHAPDSLSRLQWRAYAALPRMVPALLLAAAGALLLAMLLAARWAAGQLEPGASRVLLQLLPFAVLPVLLFRSWKLVRAVLEARRLEQASPADAQWSTPR